MQCGPATPVTLATERRCSAAVRTALFWKIPDRPTEPEMDCSRVESDLGDDSPLSHDEHSDREDDMRDCDSSDEGVHLNASTNGAAIDYGMRSPDHQGVSLRDHSQFPQNHPLGVLSNFMGVGGLQNLSNIQQHGDVLEKLKMQVRDMKVGLMDQDFSGHSNFGSTLPTPPNTAFTLPPTSMSSYSHQPQNLSQSQPQPQQTSHSHSNGFPFTPPTAPSTKDANPGSNSSTSSEASNSSQQNNGWSFEEQFKQVRQLYEISDDPKRKEFLDDLFSFMQKRGTPINRLPIMAKSVLDLYELYNLVIARGGLVDVINKKLWQEIIKGLHLPSSITSAAFTLRTQYMKYLYPYECEKKNLSTPAELQAAIDGNRREGRRSSYGQFEALHNPLMRPPVPSGMQQMSPLALVTHGNPQAGHHRLMAPPMPQMPNLMTHEIEQRMIDYLKMLQSQKEPRRSQSPEITPREALHALEMSRVALWQMYHNNTSPPASVNTSPQGCEPQREALNLSDSPPNVTIKREREHSEQKFSDREDFIQPPPAKRGIPANFQVPASSFQDEPEDQADSSHDNGHDGGHELGHSDGADKLMLSPNANAHKNVRSDELQLISGMQFKIAKRDSGTKGEQQLVVNMELNGVHYEGVLFASPAPPQQCTSSTTKPANGDATLDERTRSIMSS